MRQKKNTKIACPKCGNKYFDFPVTEAQNVFAKCRKCNAKGTEAKTKKRAISNLRISVLAAE